MRNTFFQFKEFTIYQSHSAMKVTTDGCLFGAVAAEWGKGKELLNVLDIGAGTGLLSLMLAQQLEAHIDAIEIDRTAAKEATQNFNASPWVNRLALYHQDLNEFVAPVRVPASVSVSANREYDLIISNPPFYEQDLRSPDPQKNAAKHDSTLTLDVLLEKAMALLAPAGTVALLLPFHRLGHCIGTARQIGLSLSKQVLVKHTFTHPYFRCILFFKKVETTISEEEIIIKDEAGKYTPRFVELLKDYYLHLAA